MTNEEIIQKLKDILCDAEPENRAAIEASTEQTNLFADLGLSSVGILYLVIAIEETFCIRFGDVRVADFITLGDVVRYIAAQTP